MTWQAIESAPTEEEFITTVLLGRDAGNGGVMPAIYDGSEWRALTVAGMMIYKNPTHWMPLPPPPVEE